MNDNKTYVHPQYTWSDVEPLLAPPALTQEYTPVYKGGYYIHCDDNNVCSLVLKMDIPTVTSNSSMPMIDNVTATVVDYDTLDYETRMGIYDNVSVIACRNNPGCVLWLNIIS